MVMPLIPAQNHVHQVAEFMEEGLYIAVFHETGIIRRRLREVAYQSGFGQLSAAHAIEQRHHLGMRVFASPRVHVQVHSSYHPAVIDDLPGFD